jgi:hypothetical protein
MLSAAGGVDIGNARECDHSLVHSGMTGGLERNTVLHHFRMPREREEQNENKKTDADQDLHETQDRNEPVEKRFSPKPVGNHADDLIRLEGGTRNDDRIWRPSLRRQWVWEAARRL